MIGCGFIVFPWFMVLRAHLKKYGLWWLHLHLSAWNVATKTRTFTAKCLFCRDKIKLYNDGKSSVQAKPQTRWPPDTFPALSSMHLLFLTYL